MVAEYSSIGASWNVRILIDLLEGIACLLATHDTHILPHACVGGQKDGAAQQLELQGELVRKMVSIQEEILRKLE